MAGLSLATVLFFPSSARAEKVLLKDKDWEVYTEGRVGAFASYSVGDGVPVATKMITMPDGSVVPENISPAGWQIAAEQKDSIRAFGRFR